MKKWLIICICTVLDAGCAALPKHFIELDTRRLFSLHEVLEKIEDRRVIFAGEIHAERLSHNLQYEIIRHLHSIDKRLVIAFEIFPESKQALLDQWINGSISESEFKVLYRDAVNLPFKYYRRTFEFARMNGIPIIGINGDKELIHNVSRKGPEAAPDELLERIQFSDCSSDDEYASLYGKQFHETQIPHISNGQRLRDSIMAYNISRILKKGEITVVVLAGAAHVAEPALPRLLSKHVSLPSAVIMPAVMRDFFPDVPDSKLEGFFIY